MGWTRRSGRIARERRRPCLESLETRQLLSTASARPASSPVLNPDGSTNFDQIIEASAARAAFHVDGTGQAVAVIDTGADFKNPALGGVVGPGDKVVAGVDFTGSPNGVLPTWQHGTGVAGLVAGNGGGYSGVAPGADIVALRVFGDNNSGSFTAIGQALDWVVQNHDQYHITAVNLSVADGGNYTSNLFANTGVGRQITGAISQLDALNIPVVVAAGNSFDGKAQGVGFPAIVPDVLSVTATDASDQLASTAQRLGPADGGASALKIAAPGVGITAPGGDAGTSAEDGTSFATPQVTGGIVLLQQMYQAAYHALPSIAELEQLLQQGAVPVHDGATGIEIGRLDILNSAQILGQQIAKLNPTDSGGTTGTGTGDLATPPANGGPTTTTGTTSAANPGGGAATPPVNTGSDAAKTPTVDAGSTATTTPVSPPPASPAPPSEPQTQVFVNGVSIGDYTTSQLAARYPGLFAFLKGPVTTLRIWVPAGSSVDLGPAPASVSVTLAAKHPGKVHAATAAKVHPTSVVKVVPLGQHPAVHKKVNSLSSFFSSLFPFKI